MMWCYCYHHRVWKILREFTYEDDFNNTFFSKCPSLPLSAWSRDKISKKV